MIQQSPTYMAYNAGLGGWAFSPSYITDADVVYDISHWTWENMSTFMSSIPESSKIDFLEASGVLVAKKPENIG
jgi:hypothetical protein